MYARSRNVFGYDVEDTAACTITVTASGQGAVTIGLAAGFSVNALATIGSYILGASFIFFVWNIAVSWVKGAQAPANPWGATTLEWTLPSPPNFHSYETLPRISASISSFCTRRPDSAPTSIFSRNLGKSSARSPVGGGE